MLKVYDLRTEYLENPLGIDAERPRLSWKLESDRTNVIQEAYRVIASEDEGYLNILWDSGKIKSGDSVRVSWDGPAFRSAQRVYWKVQVWAGGDKTESEIAWFETGLLKASDWQAQWIEPEDSIDRYARKPSPYLRKEFEVREGLVRARIYQTAHGLYDFWLNGTRGTNDLFKPGFTSYYTRLQYQTYDVTGLLKPGINTWAVVLGDGWWRGSTGGMYKNNFGYKLAFLGQALLEYADGSKVIISSDDGFKAATGGLLASDMKFGDVYDANLEPEGWKESGFDDSNWENVRTINYGKDMLIPTRSVPTRGKERFQATVMITPNGETVLDFGQNIAGWVEIKLRGGERGQQVTLVHGETLDKSGDFTVSNLLLEGMMGGGTEPLQEVHYIMAGKGEETYCPMFGIFGFRYVLLKGYEGKVLPGDFTAVAIYSDMEETGNFTCSNPLINKLVENSRWSQKGNFLDVPTDCPTRERSSWSGDSQVYIRTAADFMNVYSFFEKWMLDLNPEQYKSGKVGNTFPATNAIHNPEEMEAIMTSDNVMAKMMLPNWETGGILDGSAGWGDCAVINPYTMYLCYGDDQILKNQYDSAKKWVDFCASRAKEKNPNYSANLYNQVDTDAEYVVDTGFHWGEWLEAGIQIEDLMESGIEQMMKQLLETPDYRVATAFFGYSARLLSIIAGILNKTEDEKKYRNIYENVRRVYAKYFVGNGVVQEGHQAANVRTLAFELHEPQQKQLLADKLAEMVKANDYHLNTGFLGTPFLLHVLADNGYVDTAFKVLEQETSPSWLYSVKLGGTTIPETWTGFEQIDGSLNHYSYGAVCDFLFSAVAGIRPTLETPGYKHFILRPIKGGSLTNAKAVYISLYGKIESSWIVQGDKTKYMFNIPVNTTATVIIKTSETVFEDIKLTYPDARLNNGYMSLNLGSGKWDMVI